MLTTRDLTLALRDHGIFVKKPEYYVGHVNELKE